MFSSPLDDFPIHFSHVSMPAVAPTKAIKTLISVVRAGMAEIQRGCRLPDINPDIEKELRNAWIIEELRDGKSITAAYLDIEPSDDISHISINANGFRSIKVSLEMPIGGPRFSECKPETWMLWVLDLILHTFSALDSSYDSDAALVELIRDTGLMASARWGESVELTAPFFGSPALVPFEHVEAPEECRWFIRLCQNLPNTVRVRFDDYGLPKTCVHFHITSHVEHACAENAGAVDTLRAVARIEALLEQENQIK